VHMRRVRIALNACSGQQQHVEVMTPSPSQNQALQSALPRARRARASRFALNACLGSSMW
jgi:hypothetical protein